MIYILSWTSKKALKNTFQTTAFKVEGNSRTFQGLAQTFKDFSRASPKIQGLFKTVRTLNNGDTYFSKECREQATLESFYRITEL